MATGRSRPWRIGRALLLALLLPLALVAAAVLALRWWSPPTTAFMLEARLTALAHGENLHIEYRWVPLEQISPHAALAVIASEDQQFPFHYGFDFNSIREAVRAHERGGRKLRGASTISQQVAKNLFLWNGHSFVRKGLEALFTLMIETAWPKERILETYLNIAQFGRGIYGVEAAARSYFHKDAAHLNSNEAALLAVVLPNPLLLHVEAPSRYVLAQRDWTLRQMANLGGPAYRNLIEP
ncbi:MAG: monofunctional biosynthetic peptidoglycan transglycosylase [Steroidobacteraceae bacterium]